MNFLSIRIQVAMPLVDSTIDQWHVNNIKLDLDESDVNDILF